MYTHSHADPRAEFTSLGVTTEIAVIIVTFNSAEHLAPLLNSLRRNLEARTAKVVVCDNDSSDRTVAVAETFKDVEVIRMPGNLGYSAGINRGLSCVGPASYYLILNPDLVIEDGALTALLARLRITNGAAAVPQIRDSLGVLQKSLRREPTLLAQFCDAVLGMRWKHRPARLSEIELQDSAYGVAHAIDWATGAAVLLSADAVHEIGPWDERYFLYSEEVDYFARIRASGASIWYEPAAKVRHAGGGSGESPLLASLMSINRIRYAAHHHGRITAAGTTAIVILGSCLRLHRPAARSTVRAILSPNYRSKLPGQQPRLSEDVH